MVRPSTKMQSNSQMRSARSTSVDLHPYQTFITTSPGPLSSAWGKISRRSSSISSGHTNPGSLKRSLPEDHSPIYEDKLVWKEKGGRRPSAFKWNRRELPLGVAAAVLLLLVCLGYAPAECNPYAVAGQFHVDYSEPANSFWQVDLSASKDRACRAPRHMSKLIDNRYDSLEWMRNKTVLLIGDSIERDHLSLFCDTVGREPEVVKEDRKYFVPQSSDSVARRNSDKKMKERLSRIAFKGMQESTLPRTCFIEELNFLMVNLYHFGLDEEDFWQDLDQFHPPGRLEDRFKSLVEPFIAELQADGREPDLVEISSGMFDLARWSKQDIASHQSTEEPLDQGRLDWYESRMKAFLNLTTKTFPTALKLWRGITVPENQAAEIDYFNDRFGHSPATVTPLFAVNRVLQMDEVARKLVQPFRPGRLATKSQTAGSSPPDIDLSPTDEAKTSQSGKVQKRVLRPTRRSEFSYNTWSNLISGFPTHLLDRLHGGDLATPGAVLWSDVMLWHLQHMNAMST